MLHYPCCCMNLKNDIISFFCQLHNIICSKKLQMIFIHIFNWTSWKPRYLCCISCNKNDQELILDLSRTNKRMPGMIFLFWSVCFCSLDHQPIVLSYNVSDTSTCSTADPWRWHNYCVQKSYVSHPQKVNTPVSSYMNIMFDIIRGWLNLFCSSERYVNC